MERSDDPVVRRTLEDLRSYEKFFPEVLDIEVGIRCKADQNLISLQYLQLISSKILLLDCVTLLKKVKCTYCITVVRLQSDTHG